MPCDHAGGPELITMAEEHLRGTGETARPGMRFRWAENVSGGMWTSVVVEIERRGEQWVVTRLDRNRDSLPGDETGFRML
jgi:hypothetical protein